MLATPRQRLSVPSALSPRRWREDFLARPRGERIALAVLAGVLVVGILLRVWLWLAVRPAFFGYVDTQSYIGIASDITDGNPFKTTSFPQGYPRFLVLLHAIAAQPALVPFVQHIMSVASALLLYATARRIGAPVWAAVVPAAVVMLMGIQAFIAQAILSEPLFTFLVALLLYTGVRSLGSRNLAWPAVTGLLVGLVPIVRFAGIVLVPVVLAWFLLAGRSWGQRLAFGGVATAVAVAVLGGYTLWASQGEEQQGTAGATSWPLYARVAGFADCREFTPPPGTRVLCDATPPGQRTQGGNDYLYSVVTSPAYRALANGQATPQDVKDFTFAALRNQPLDYLTAITLDQLRWIDPVYSGSGRGQEWEGFMMQMVDGADATAATGGGGAAIDYRPFYPEPGFSKDAKALAPLLAWERLTRLEGFVAIGLFGLALAGLWAPTARAKVGAVLACAVTAALAIGPASLLMWQARYGIPVAIPLGLAAGIGAWAVAVRTRERRSRVYTAEQPTVAMDDHRQVV